MTNKISAEIIAHSKRKETGEELITYKLVYPHIILAEVNTYRMLSKNTSSSRAIPFEKMCKIVETEPFIPIAWQKHHKGMQGFEYELDKDKIQLLELEWVSAKNYAIKQAKTLNNMGVSKQICNRLLEPFMWVTQLVTGTKESFIHLFNQRCPRYEIFTENSEMINYIKSKKEAINLYPELKERVNDDNFWLLCNKGQAEIHFMQLAECMYECLKNSKLNILEGNKWHIPFAEEIIDETGEDYIPFEELVIYSVAKTARISYTKINDDETLTLEQARKIYEKCLNGNHYSAFEHIAKSMLNDEYQMNIRGTLNEINNKIIISNDNKGWCKNFKGFITYRQYLEDNEKFKQYE